ncbi:MAG TPA: glycerate kinase, partial [Candidatus Bathyarchaeia archaeon]|nr:glycerate kinase [Candidatus Bathyarchaeia archaeon]
NSRRAIAEAINSALVAADPRAIMKNNVRLEGDALHVSGHTVSLSKFSRLLVIGAGKAAGNMAAELERILDGRITAGSVNIPAYTKPWPRSSRISFNPATHPIPSEKGVRGVKKMLELVGTPSKTDLVICLVSGGGSALMPLPASGVSLRDKQTTTEMLLKSGASIEETNCVRKHLSGVKGGRLAEKLHPATVLTWIISDVVGDPLGAIASGPTVPDETTYSDAYRVVQLRGLLHRIPRAVKEHLKKGKAGRLPETPKPGSRVFERVFNTLVGTNKQSCFEAAYTLERNGYQVMILSTRIRGEAREVGKVLSGVVSDIRENRIPISPPAAIVTGGETTVTVHGRGRGGRNQELVLSAAQLVRGLSGVVLSSVGTDGVDGPTDAAGAVADATTVERGLNKGLDTDAYLRENNSYSFFKKLNDLIITGPTGTNVNDIVIAIVDSSKHKRDTGSLSAGR